MAGWPQTWVPPMGAAGGHADTDVGQKGNACCKIKIGSNLCDLTVTVGKQTALRGGVRLFKLSSGVTEFSWTSALSDVAPTAPRIGLQDGAVCPLHADGQGLSVPARQLRWPGDRSPACS